MPRILLLGMLGMLAAFALATSAHAAAEFPGQDLLLVSRNAAGAPANGPSGNAVISQDKRFGRVVAFESAAMNLAGGAGGGSNVYVARRAAGYGENGTPWQFGSINAGVRRDARAAGRRPVAWGVAERPCDRPSCSSAADRSG